MSKNFILESGESTDPNQVKEEEEIVLNEFVAYRSLAEIATTLSPKSFMIATFALCSFGNLGSIAVQIGGIGELAPNQRKNLARLGVRALICGTLSCYLSAAIVGVLL